MGPYGSIILIFPRFLTSVPREESGAQRCSPWCEDTSMLKAALWKQGMEVSPAIFLKKCDPGALRRQAVCSFLGSEKADGMGERPTGAHSTPPGGSSSQVLTGN